MAEVATIYRLYGASGTKNSLAGKVGRFCTQDAEPVLNNPCKIPPSGETYYSYRTTDCLGITGDFNQVRDIYVHGDGNFAADWGLDALNGGCLLIGHKDTGDSGLPIDVALHGSNQYAQATGTPGLTGHSIVDAVNGHPYYKDETLPTLNFDNVTSTSPLLIDSGPYTDDFYSKAWVLSLKLVPTATYGAKSPKAVTVTYNIF